MPPDDSVDLVDQAAAGEIVETNEILTNGVDWLDQSGQSDESEEHKLDQLNQPGDGEPDLYQLDHLNQTDQQAELLSLLVKDKDEDQDSAVEQESVPSEQLPNSEDSAAVNSKAREEVSGAQETPSTAPDELIAKKEDVRILPGEISELTSGMASCSDFEDLSQKPPKGTTMAPTTKQEDNTIKGEVHVVRNTPQMIYRAMFV